MGGGERLEAPTRASREGTKAEDEGQRAVAAPEPAVDDVAQLSYRDTRDTRAGPRIGR